MVSNTLLFFVVVGRSANGENKGAENAAVFGFFILSRNLLRLGVDE